MSDLISRQDAIDAIVAWTVEDRPNEAMPTNLVERVNALPSAERKGKWVLIDGYRCSLCNHKLQTTGIPMYCPNCGASMVRGERR